MARTREALMGGEEGDQLVIELPGVGSLGYAGSGPAGRPGRAGPGGHARNAQARWSMERRRRTTVCVSGRTYPQLLWIVPVLCAVAGRCR
jgi:hypothetical protein